MKASQFALSASQKRALEERKEREQPRRRKPRRKRDISRMEEDALPGGEATRPSQRPFRAGKINDQQAVSGAGKQPLGSPFVSVSDDEPMETQSPPPVMRQSL